MIAATDRAPATAARRLRALRCDCGEPADTIHLVSTAGVALRPWPIGDEPATPQSTYPSRGHGTVLSACCADHDLGGYSIAVDRLIARWSSWLEHLARKPWRGDLLLLELDDTGRAGWR